MSGTPKKPMLEIVDLRVSVNGIEIALPVTVAFRAPFADFSNLSAGDGVMNSSCAITVCSIKSHLAWMRIIRGCLASSSIHSLRLNM